MLTLTISAIGPDAEAAIASAQARADVDAGLAVVIGELQGLGGHNEAVQWLFDARSWFLLGVAGLYRFGGAFLDGLGASAAEAAVKLLTGKPAEPSAKRVVDALEAEALKSQASGSTFMIGLPIGFGRNIGTVVPDLASLSVEERNSVIGGILGRLYLTLPSVAEAIDEVGLRRAHPLGANKDSSVDVTLCGDGSYRVTVEGLFPDDTWGALTIVISERGEIAALDRTFGVGGHTQRIRDAHR